MKLNHRIKRNILLILIFLAIVVILFFFSKQNNTQNSPSSQESALTNSILKVEFIDVGQADSILVSCGNEWMLIDGGNKGDSSLLYSVLRKNGVKNLKYIILTHRDEDHVGGLPAAFHYVEDVGGKIEKIYSSCAKYTTKCFIAFSDAVKKSQNEIIVPQNDVKLSLGDANIDILVPTEKFRRTNDYKNNPNNQSLIVKITHGQNSFIFAGDCELEEENNLLAKYENTNMLKNIDVLKVGHHGSDTATSVHWLETIMPRYAVISCGKNNKYGHPHQVTLDKLNQAGVIIKRTDEIGDIFFVSDGKKLQNLLTN